MAATDDLVKTIAADLDERIKSYTSTLISSDAARHDKLCGTIIGLNEAKTSLLARARDYRLGYLDEDAPVSRVGGRLA